MLLTAGALGTPQLLMLSGVGPAQDLQRLGVPLVAELSSLGKDIADIPINAINVLSPTPVEESSLEVSCTFHLLYGTVCCTVCCPPPLCTVLYCLTTTLHIAVCCTSDDTPHRLLQAVASYRRLSPLCTVQLVGILPSGNIIEGASGGNHTVCWPAGGEINTVPPHDRSDQLTSFAETVLGYLPEQVTQPLDQAGFILSKASHRQRLHHFWGPSTP